MNLYIHLTIILLSTGDQMKALAGNDARTRERILSKCARIENAIANIYFCTMLPKTKMHKNIHFSFSNLVSYETLKIKFLQYIHTKNLLSIIS